MHRFTGLSTLIYGLCLCSCSECALTTLFPLGKVSVCPGGQLLLICERMSGSVLFWDVSVPHMGSTTTNEQRIVASEGSILSPEFRIGVTEFIVTRTSESPLISQLLISNVTTEINGSTIYCSEDGDENNAPMIVVNIMLKDEPSRNVNHSLNITMVNQLLRSDDVTVTLQWPREAGAVYSVNVSPEVSHTAPTTVSNDIIAINLTVSYNIQYNVSIVSSLCGVTTTKVLNYHDAYADCGLPPVDGNTKLSYSSTLEGSILTLTCENEMSLNSTNETILSVICDSNGRWIPNPADFIQFCSPFSTTVSPTTVAIEIASTAAATRSRDVVIISVASSISSFILGSLLFLSIGLACGCHWGRRWRLKILSEDGLTENQRISEQTAPPNPLYEEIFTQEQEPLELKENAAYGSRSVNTSRNNTVLS